MEYIGFSVYYKNFSIYQNKNDYVFWSTENEMAEEN